MRALIAVFLLLFAGGVSAAYADEYPYEVVGYSPTAKNYSVRISAPAEFLPAIEGVLTSRLQKTALFFEASGNGTTQLRAEYSGPIGRQYKGAAGAGLQYSEEGKFDLRSPLTLPEETEGKWSVLAGVGAEASQEYGISFPAARFNGTDVDYGASRASAQITSIARTVSSIYSLVRTIQQQLNKSENREQSKKKDKNN